MQEDYSGVSKRQIPNTWLSKNIILLKFQRIITLIYFAYRAVST